MYILVTFLFPRDADISIDIYEKQTTTTVNKQTTKPILKWFN